MMMQSCRYATRLGRVVLGAFFSTTLLLSARPYVVDSRHAQASDSNPGTREAPLRTISEAARRVDAGDEVVVRPGLYREAVTLTRSGAQGKPIVFRSEERWGAVISGSDLLTNLQDEGEGVWSAMVPRQGDHEDAPVGGNPQWVYLNDEPLERAESRDRLIPGSFFLDTTGVGPSWRVTVALPEGLDLKDATLEYACREGLITPQGDQGSELPLNDIHIQGFTFKHNADWFRGKPSIRVTGQRWLVEDNHILWASYTGGILMRRSNQAVVRHNLVEWIGCQGIGGGNNVDLLVEGNTVRYNNWRLFDWGNEGGGSKWSQNIDACYRGNEFAYNNGPGLWNDGANSGTLYERNICHDNLARSLYSEINWDEVMQDNIVYNTGEGGINDSHSSGLLIRRNIVFNNGFGIALAGHYARPADHDEAWYPLAVANMYTVPGISTQRVVNWEAGFLKYFVAPKAVMINNCLVRENILFDNCLTMMENRDYRTASPIDAFVNNFSDRNIYWAATEKSLFNVSYSYQYPTLAEWQRLSGRDEHSVFANPRNPATKLPAWAVACRKDWDLKMRPITEVDGIRNDGVRQELYKSPMAQIAIGRMLRSPYLKGVSFKDPRVRGAVFEVEGQRTLALWTTHPAERRYVRLRLDQPVIGVESGYLARRMLATSGGCVTLLVTYNPTYLRGIGETFAEAPSGVLQAQPFNIAGQPVPASVSFVNEGTEKASLSAVFTARGFAVQPAKVQRELAAGETNDIALVLKPDGTLRRGTGLLHMTATLGGETIRRTAVFSVGESDLKLPPAPANLVVDGALEDWGAIVKEGVPLATLNDASQVLAGPKGGWHGPSDLSARLYGAWTDKALYLAVVVDDDTLVCASGAKDAWGAVDVQRYDALEVSLDGRAPEMQWQRELNKGCLDFVLSPRTNGQPPALSLNGKTWQTNIVAATAATKTGYIAELMIPLSASDYPAGQWQAGRPIRLSLLLFDVDTPGAPVRKVMGWSSSRQQKNDEDASGWATVILDDRRR